MSKVAKSKTKETADTQDEPKLKLALEPEIEFELEDYQLGYKEFFAISRQLEKHHAVFYQLWELGRPVFTKSIPTAAVRFNKEGHCIEFMFNLKFWKSLTDDQRCFIIAHECLHVILKHGIRANVDADPGIRRANNIAMDVVINELLLEQFAFQRKHVDPKEEYCFLEGIFKDEKTGKIRADIERNQNYEYYFNRLPEETKLTRWVLVDIHDFLNGSESAEAIGRLADALSPEDKESLRKTIEKFSEKEDTARGTARGGNWKFMDSKPVPPKRKWETVIRRWAQKFIRNDFDFLEHWARANPRLMELPEDVVMPSEMEIQDAPDEGRIKVYFYLDTSGSCSHLAERFWKAAKSLPKARFDKRLFCFDTEVYAVNEKEGKLYGFGGTSFDILEEHIQGELKKNPTEKYPAAVFVITDGYGNQVVPARPKNWYVFLTEHSTDTCFPKDCHRFKLADYE